MAAPALVKYVSLFGSMTVSAQTLAQQVAKARAVQQVSMQPTQVSMSVRLRANDVTQTFSLLGGQGGQKNTQMQAPVLEDHSAPLINLEDNGGGPNLEDHWSILFAIISPGPKVERNYVKLHPCQERE